MRRNCPEWFNERIKQVGGCNQYGQPIFKLVWAESETMRDGGYFMRDGYQGYRDVLAIGGEKCWAIMMWEPTSAHGTPYRWYKDHTDESTGLVTLGQYPYQGRYRVIKKLVHRELVNGEWFTYRLEPTTFILEVMIPLLTEWNKLTLEKKNQVVEEQLEAEQRERDRILDDCASSIHIRRNSPMVEKRMAIMEKSMAQATAIASRTQPGMRQMGV